MIPIRILECGLRNQELNVLKFEHLDLGLGK